MQKTSIVYLFMFTQLYVKFTVQVIWKINKHILTSFEKKQYYGKLKKCHTSKAFYLNY